MQVTVGHTRDISYSSVCCLQARPLNKKAVSPMANLHTYIFIPKMLRWMEPRTKFLWMGKLVNLVWGGQLFSIRIPVLKETCIGCQKYHQASQCCTSLKTCTCQNGFFHAIAKRYSNSNAKRLTLVSYATMKYLAMSSLILARDNRRFKWKINDFPISWHEMLQTHLNLSQ